MPLSLGPRRGVLAVVDRAQEPADAAAFATLDVLYRTLCGLLYNYVPLSGHPGGSISSGRIAQALLFDAVDLDLARPERDDADVVSYAAGHKALGLYALWALRDEVARLGAPGLLPDDARARLRLEDLLGFRRNPRQATPLFRAFGAKALDGHPTPATPFVRLATGASGVGLASSIGLALAARDLYGADAPRVHVIEGEGGLTPGRVAEALAAAATAGLDNVVVHVDWNQASIDSDRVCRDGERPGEYVPWSPAELFHLHDWNVVSVADGFDLGQVLAAQRAAAEAARANGQPAAIVYRTVKGHGYGLEGRASHGAGHALCSDGFHAATAPLAALAGRALPACEAAGQRCSGGRGADGAALLEACFWDALGLVRAALAARPADVAALATRLVRSRERLDARARERRADAPRVDAVYDLCAGVPAAGHGRDGAARPPELALAPGTETTLRGELGRALGVLNRASGGALFVAAADLLGSTSVGAAADGFPGGFFHASSNPRARRLAAGGIAEDAMSGLLAGLSSFGAHVGVGASYAAFLAALGHVAARLHAIGAEARLAAWGVPRDPLVLVCAHAGLATGEDGPTHADPQALQLLQENFPGGSAITLTPWEPAEVWPLLAAAFARRPALIAPFVTRPAVTVPDRAALGLAPAEHAARGVYRLREARGGASGTSRASGTPDLTVVLQESGVVLEFVHGALPRLLGEGVDVEAFVIGSAELFDALPAAERAATFPDEAGRRAIGITGFTRPTLYRWVRSADGLAASLDPYASGRFPGSGAPAAVLAEAGLDGEGQYRALRRWLDR